MPFERAISSRYGQAPSNPVASSRIRRRSPPLGRLAEQLVGRVRPAVAEAVRTVGVAREADRARDPAAIGRSRGPRPAPRSCRATEGRRTATAPTAERLMTDLAGQDRRRRRRAVGDRGRCRTAVIGAPRTRTLATTVAGARRSAASQVADVGRQQGARAEAPAHWRPSGEATTPKPAGHAEIADEDDEADAEPRGAEDRRRDRADQQPPRDDDLDRPHAASRPGSSSRPCPTSRRSAARPGPGRRAGRRARRSGTSPGAHRGTARPAGRPR